MLLRFIAHIGTASRVQHMWVARHVPSDDGLVLAHCERKEDGSFQADVQTHGCLHYVMSQRVILDCWEFAAGAPDLLEMALLPRDIARTLDEALAALPKRTKAASHTRTLWPVPEIVPAAAPGGCDIDPEVESLQKMINKMRQEIDLYDEKGKSSLAKKAVKTNTRKVVDDVEDEESDEDKEVVLQLEPRMQKLLLKAKEAVTKRTCKVGKTGRMIKKRRIKKLVLKASPTEAPPAGLPVPLPAEPLPAPDPPPAGLPAPLAAEPLPAPDPPPAGLPRPERAVGCSSPWGARSGDSPNSRTVDSAPSATTTATSATTRFAR